MISNKSEYFCSHFLSRAFLCPSLSVFFYRIPASDSLSLHRFLLHFFVYHTSCKPSFPLFSRVNELHFNRDLNLGSSYIMYDLYKKYLQVTLLHCIQSSLIIGILLAKV